jgi:hypothetical protein
MTLAEQQDAADSRQAKKASGPTRAPINNLEEEGRSLENLRIEVEGKGKVHRESPLGKCHHVVTYSSSACRTTV